MKKALLVILLLPALYTQAQTSFVNDSIQYLCAQNYSYANMPTNSRATVQTSDTIDILHFIISLNVTDFANKTIGGNTQVQFKSKLNGVNQLFLDLLRMNIDSIRQNNQPVTYTYADSITLHINLLNTLQQGDSAAVTVYYHGKPETDASFGGFYFQGSFAYNLGVGANYYPHMLGRAWYPCFDNFVERATYEYYVTTASNRRALCNGALLGSADNGNSTTTWHWKLAEAIPGYLASVTVGPYAPLEMSFEGLNGPVPVVLATSAGDTANMRKSMSHLEDAFHTFEEHYGPYRWNRIGYCSVPFSNIAMEHATNITYPSGVLLGNTSYEYLYAHELAHHWFGNLVTPSTAEDYWLKEGWAVFSEKLFFEAVYGHQRYLDEVATIHEQSLHYAHIYDKSYLPVSPMPQQYTYGKTVYNKASDMAHVMPAYVGEAKFYQCLKNYFTDNAYTDQDSYTFRDYMSNCAEVDLTDYFNDWIFSPGFPHFSVDSFKVDELAGFTESNYHVTVHIRQRLNNAPHYYHNVPLEITYMDENLETVTEKIIINGPCTVYETDLPFSPKFVCTDMAEKIQDAITENYDTITATGTYNFVYGKMNVVASAVPGTTFLRTEHNFIAPDTIKTPIPGLHLSQERYWRVDGIIPDGFDASGTILYNGQAPSTPSSASNYYLDTRLITNVEDSLVVMYRPDIATDWQIDTGVVLNTQSNNSNKQGAFTINHIRKGEYALAIWQANKVDSVLAALEADTCNNYVKPNGIKDVLLGGRFNIYPNPTQHNFVVEGILNHAAEIEVYNMSGQQLYRTQVQRGALRQQVNTGQWGSGIFMLRIANPVSHEAVTKKVVVIKE